MNIVLYHWKAYQYQQILEQLRLSEHQVTEYLMPIQNPELDLEYTETLCCYLKQHHCDCLFSINYFPVLSEACLQAGIPYVCWTCDSPLIAMYHSSVLNPCNYIFVFDRTDYLHFQSLGVPHLFYLPLGTGIPLSLDPLPPSPTAEYAISFIGSLYEKNSYDQIADKLPPYLKGYLDCALEAQLQITGGNLLYRLLTPEICEELDQISDYQKSRDSFSDLQLLFANTVLGFKAASLNRIRSLNALAGALLPCRGKEFDTGDGVHLFTNSEWNSEKWEDLLPLVQTHAAVDYMTEMPDVIRKSRINLHFTIPNIRSGLPLRIWDIMGSGGFLLSNEQAEIADLLDPGVDLEIFTSTEELIEKCQFYLKREDLRKQIARHGYLTVQQNYTGKQQLEKLLQTVMAEIL